jgi:hypothetical protein
LQFNRRIRPKKKKPTSDPINVIPKSRRHSSELLSTPPETKRNTGIIASIMRMVKIKKTATSSLTNACANPEFTLTGTNQSPIGSTKRKQLPHPMNPTRKPHIAGGAISTIPIVKKG